MKNLVSLLIIGAGSRGNAYAEFAEQFPERAVVTAVAEPRAAYREAFATRYNIPAERVFDDWTEALAAGAEGRIADAVIIATPDHLHRDPAIAFAAQGYPMLLEKPMAPQVADCEAIVAAVEAAGIPFAVCHVLRYTDFTRKLKEVLDAGTIGDIVTLQHMEGVGYWHQAHSFVRGNWRNEAESSFMLLAKSCHDLDWISHIMGQPCTRVSSFGSLKHFRKEEHPEGAADRCLDCVIEADCPYSAKRLYEGVLAKGKLVWPLDVVITELKPEALEEALRNGPYGRCVYACDNDVVDHQVVNMEFEGGCSAVFTMTAFSHMKAGRYTRIFGTRGQIDGDSRRIKIHDFLTDETSEIDTQAGDGSILGGHGGGDGGIMDAFLAEVAGEREGAILSGSQATLESHRMVFAAEQARRDGDVKKL